MRSSNSCGGIGVRWGWASGAKRWKSCQWKWERTSVIESVTPGTCWAEKKKIWRAAASSKACSRCMRDGILEVLETIVVRAKQNMLPAPLMAPDMSSDDHGKKFLICNGLLSLRGPPWTKKPLSRHISAKAQGTCRVGRNFYVCCRWIPRKKPEANAMPFDQKLVPPLQIAVKLLVKADRMVLLAEAAEKINHPAQKGSTRPDNFSSMVEVTDQWLKLPSVTPPPGQLRCN